MGLAGVVRGKAIKTTVQDRATPCPADLVNRQFQPSRPNLLWVSDFTHVATWQGFVHAAFVIDALARRIVGWRVRLMQGLGYGAGHEYHHDAQGAFSGQNHFPDGMARARFYEPTDRGAEAAIAERMAHRAKLRR